MSWYQKVCAESKHKVCNFFSSSVSTVSISFENYRMVHPYEDSNSSEEEVDWQDTRNDPYRAGINSYHILISHLHYLLLLLLMFIVLLLLYCQYCSYSISLISYCVYLIYLYITTIHMHILCTFLLFLHFWLDAELYFVVSVLVFCAMAKLNRNLPPSPPLTSSSVFNSFDAC